MRVRGAKAPFQTQSATMRLSRLSVVALVATLLATVAICAVVYTSVMNSAADDAASAFSAQFAADVEQVGLLGVSKECAAGTQLAVQIRFRCRTWATTRVSEDRGHPSLHCQYVHVALCLAVMSLGGGGATRVCDGSLEKCDGLVFVHFDASFRDSSPTPQCRFEASQTPSAQ